jgi:hypothetical protein
MIVHFEPRQGAQNPGGFMKPELTKLFDYLCLQDKVPARADLVIGFGHFDPAIPERCAQLYQQLNARAILFTGGIGAGTADLNQAEADYFHNTCHAAHPDIPAKNIFVENRSTNTSENILFSIALLKTQSPDWHFESGIQRAALVATPYRQRRVYLTFKKLLPHIELFNLPPERTLEANRKLFANKGEHLDDLLVPELDRILTYPDKGWIVREPVPADILKTRERQAQARSRNR